MLRGLRNEYLRSIGPGKEAFVCNTIRELHGRLTQTTNQWTYLWKTILRYFYPTMDNIFLEGQGGTVRSNEVYSSEQSTLVNDYVDFLLKSMFPETAPWFRAGFITENGLPIERSELDVETLRYADDIVMMCRHWLKKAGFYEQVRSSLIHDTLLGNSAMQAILSWNEISFMDVPISRIGIGRDSVRRIDSVTEVFKYHEWEIIKRFGREALALFERPKKGINQNQRLPSMGGWGFGQNTVGAVAPFNAGGSGTDWLQKTKDVIRYYTPNKSYSPIPHNEAFYPEMDYLCFLVTFNTGRLLDVEVHPTLPFGISEGAVVQGEDFGRGIGNLMLPDVSVLNAKKKMEYTADAIQSQSPLLVKGSGFVKSPGDHLRPFQKIYLHRNTEMQPLYDRAPLMQRAHTTFETEVEGVGKGFRKDRIDVALADRMTATEYVRRRDGSHGLFAPTAGRFYRQTAKPCLDTLISWLIVTDKAPAMPAELMSGKVKFHLETFSTFSYSQESEVGENLVRAFGPLLEIFPERQDLLDNLDADAYLRSSLSRNELARFVPSKDAVRDIRDFRARQEMAMQRGMPTGADKGAQKFEAQKVFNELATGGDSDYLAV